jgi:hypothetical protein
MLRCPRTHSGRAPALQGRSVCTVTTVGVHSCGGRVTPSAFTDGHGRAALMPFPGLRRTAEPGASSPAAVRAPSGTSAGRNGTGGRVMPLRVTGYLRWLPALGTAEISGLRRHARRRERAAAGGPAPSMRAIIERNLRHRLSRTQSTPNADFVHPMLSEQRYATVHRTSRSACHRYRCADHH